MGSSTRPPGTPPALRFAAIELGHTQVIGDLLQTTNYKGTMYQENGHHLVCKFFSAYLNLLVLNPLELRLDQRQNFSVLLCSPVWSGGLVEPATRIKLKAAALKVCIMGLRHHQELCPGVLRLHFFITYSPCS